ncbi:MAG: hypothetical protein H6565_06690 [Lewinellaceae bacterium]|nr:hypothetical protein [Lewinellaceae bacterium]
MQEHNESDVILRLTALWAFSESALGGVMHALKIPFTGLLVGGFAVLSIGMVAHVSRRRAGAVLRATMLVVLVKAVVSPHSPPTAYLAVGFQGLSGALILCYMRPHALAALLFGFLAILESALQKILVLLLLFGKPLFEAFDLFTADVLEKFGIRSDISWSLAAAWTYISLYGCWGLMLGYWIIGLPGQLDGRSAEYSQLAFRDAHPKISTEKKKGKKWLFTVLVLLFMVLTFILTGEKASGARKAIYAVLRTLAVLSVWLFLFQPLVQWLIRRWAARQAEKEKSSLLEIMDMMPGIRAGVRPVYEYVSRKYTGWRRMAEFVVAMFVIAVYSRNIPAAERDKTHDPGEK